MCCLLLLLLLFLYDIAMYDRSRVGTCPSHRPDRRAARVRGVSGRGIRLCCTVYYVQHYYYYYMLHYYIHLFHI